MTHSLRSVFVQFYCLPIRDILALFAVATWGFLWLDRRFRKALLWKVLLSLVFAAFTGVILYLTVSQREGGAVNTLMLVPFHSYREVLAGGSRELYRSNFMNVVLFYPSGLLLAALLPRKIPAWIRVLLTAALFALLSARVEYLQYSLSMGRAEIDDVIHNTLGALLGSLGSLIPLPNKKERT
jgi:glycopeptide antibiotics resistance protein